MVIDKCPACGSGPIVRAKIKKLDKNILICEECDSIWFDIKDVGVVEEDVFPSFAKEHGLLGLWSELEILD